MREELTADVSGRQKDVRIDIGEGRNGELPFDISDIGIVDFGVGEREKDVSVQTEADRAELNFRITGRSERKETYAGPYTVISEADTMQILPTQNKMMTENVLVLPIPYNEVSNKAGGLTATIG